MSTEPHCCRNRRASRLLAASAVAASAAAGCSAPTPEAPADVVIVSLDTVRADHLGAWGYPDGTTPYLDRFARRHVQFAEAIAQAASTLPSHRSMFQSRAASAASDEHPMLAEILRAAGYATAGFTGGGNVSAEFGFGAGFDVYEENDAGIPWATDRYLEWRETVPAPRFGFVHGYDAHVPYDPPPPYAELYGGDYSGPVTPGETRALCRAVRGLGGATPPNLNEEDRRRMVALYDGGLRHTDASFGRLIRELESRDGWDRTTLFVMSDHGEEFWDHGTVLHSHTVYQELVHVPLLWKPLERPTRSLVRETVRNLDLAPSVLASRGLPVPEGYQGESLLARIRATAGVGLPAVSEMREWKSILLDEWKLIANAERRRPALYNLAADPGERRDRAPENPRRAELLGRELSGLVTGVSVQELSGGEISKEVEERLRALGYVE